MYDTVDGIQKRRWKRTVGAKLGYEKGGKIDQSEVDLGHELTLYYSVMKCFLLAPSHHPAPLINPGHTDVVPCPPLPSPLPSGLDVRNNRLREFGTTLYDIPLAEFRKQAVGAQR